MYSKLTATYKLQIIIRRKKWGGRPPGCQEWGVRTPRTPRRRRPCVYNIFCKSDFFYRGRKIATKNKSAIAILIAELVKIESLFRDRFLVVCDRGIADYQIATPIIGHNTDPRKDTPRVEICTEYI